MGENQVRRHRGIIDDVLGGAFSFLIELAIVIALLAAAFVVAVVSLAVTG